MGARKPRTRGSGKFTEAGYWTMIRSTLRAKSRYWKPVTETKKKARRKYQGENKLQRWEYQCAQCKGWFKDKEVKVDHINPVGTLKCAEDLPAFVENLFCEEDNLQCLCDACHTIKTKEERENRNNK